MTTPLNTSSDRYEKDIEQAAEVLLGHTGAFVVLAHENPDGDALGSVLGMTRALRSAGKEVYAPMLVPKYLQFLPSEGEICPPLEEWPENAAAIVLDVDNNNPERVAGADLSTFTGVVVNLDHHGTNLRKATACVVEPSKPAATMIVSDVLSAMKIPLTEEIATPLLLGLSTDTGSFSFDSVTPETFEAAAHLRRCGARLGWLTDQLRQNPRSYYELLREVLSTLEFKYQDRVVLACVNEAMLQKVGATWEDIESYVSLLRNAKGSLLAVMIKDFGDHVKLSLRSRGDVSAQNVAVALGGGGHVPAAGASIAEPYSAVLPKLEAAIKAELTRVGVLI